jgi:outer membrane biosynthesis protein TonB
MNVLELRDVRSMAARYPLATAFALSLLIHLCMYQFWHVGKQLGWWRYQATWLLDLRPKKNRHPVPVRLTEAQKAALARQAQPKPREIPLTFVEVDPRTATAEPPKDTVYYGVVNTRAANPDATVEAEKPKADGKQNKMIRLEDVPKPKPFPLQPLPEPNAALAEAAAEPRPKPAQEPGDLAKSLLEDLRDRQESFADARLGQADRRERPRTLVEARTQRGLAGQKMRQDGGVASRGRLSLDVKATAFSAYDADFIAAVQQRWYDLLDNSPFAQRSGKVVLEFNLMENGRITGMKVLENDVGDLLASFCQHAIHDPAPYRKWPGDMRRMIGADLREVTFTFYYY